MDTWELTTIISSGNAKNVCFGITCVLLLKTSWARMVCLGLALVVYLGNVQDEIRACE